MAAVLPVRSYVPADFQPLLFRIFPLKIFVLPWRPLRIFLALLGPKILLYLPRNFSSFSTSAEA